jgi:hypothetical protein
VVCAIAEIVAAESTTKRRESVFTNLIKIPSWGDGCCRLLPWPGVAQAGARSIDRPIASSR